MTATSKTATRTTLTLLPYQSEAVEKLYQGMVHKIPKLLRAPTRTGKSYALAVALRKAQDAGLFKDPSKMVNILVLTTKTVKTQTARVFAEAGVEGSMVCNYATLRSDLGGLFIDWIKNLQHGVLAEHPVWRTADKPEIIICDECQLVKNHLTLQAQLIQAAAEQGIYLIFASATPFVTLLDAKVLCIGLGLTDEHNWAQFADAHCARGSDIREASPKSSANLRDTLLKKDRLVEFTNIKYTHRVFNKCVKITVSPQKMEFYAKAYLDYLEECRKAERGTPQGIRARWVANNKFRQRAEDIRKEDIADYAVNILHKEERQILMGSNFLNTLRGYWTQLTKVHHIPPERIGYIVGGQPERQRQRNIDLFQKGELDFILLTLKAGGAGISLHHDRKGTRPRHCVLPPTWSPIELIQVLGRAHGPTSLSTTHQDVLWIKGTIEDYVADKVAQGFSCLGELVNKKETWVNLFDELSEEDAEKMNEEMYKQQIEVTEDGEELLFPAEAFENSSVE